MAFGKTIRTIRIIVGERSKVTSFTVLRLDIRICSSTLMTSSDFVPRIIATSVPLSPCPARLVTTVYNSPQLKKVSSIHRLGPIFCGNRTYVEACSSWPQCLYSLIKSLYCEVSCLPFRHKLLLLNLCHRRYFQSSSFKKETNSGVSFVPSAVRSSYV